MGTAQAVADDFGYKPVSDMLKLVYDAIAIAQKGLLANPEQGRGAHTQPDTGKTGTGACRFACHVGCHGRSCD